MFLPRAEAVCAELEDAQANDVGGGHHGRALEERDAEAAEDNVRNVEPVRKQLVFGDDHVEAECGAGAGQKVDQGLTNGLPTEIS